jgi:uncharacterized GH25 family protein
LETSAHDFWIEPSTFRPTQGGIVTFALRVGVGFAGDRGSFKVLHQEKPIANILVMALHRDDPRLRSSARSDARGRVKLDVAQSGVWLIKAVHLVPAGDEWESLWASLTFER